MKAKVKTALGAEVELEGTAEELAKVIGDILNPYKFTFTPTPAPYVPYTPYQPFDPTIVPGYGPQIIPLEWKVPDIFIVTSDSTSFKVE